MQTERFKLPLAVFLFLTKDDQVLLLKRQNTSWYNGSYDLPSGHIDGGESLTTATQREAKEEVGIDIERSDLQFKHFAHGFFVEDDKEYIYVFFEARRWSGTPTNAEPEKCSEVEWFPLDKLPSNLTPGAKEGLEAYKSGQTYSERGF